jgi:hypothetical protein
LPETLIRNERWLKEIQNVEVNMAVSNLDESLDFT